MAAGSFGRKGVTAVAPRRGGLVADERPRSFQPMRDIADTDAEAETRRAAFLAAEKRRGEQADAAPLPSAETEAALRRLKVEALPPTDRSLRTAYSIWFLLGLGGGHRFYLRRPYTGGVQAMLFLGCVGTTVLLQYYEAFAGLALSWVWYLADGIRLRRLHLRSGRE